MHKRMDFDTMSMFVRCDTWRNTPKEIYLHAQMQYVKKMHSKMY